MGLFIGFDVVYYGNGVSIVYVDVFMMVDFGGGVVIILIFVYVGIFLYL